MNFGTVAIDKLERVIESSKKLGIKELSLEFLINSFFPDFTHELKNLISQKQTGGYIEGRLGLLDVMTQSTNSDVLFAAEVLFGQGVFSERELPKNEIVLRELIEEDFIQYKKPSMFLGFPHCDGKCNKDAGETVCQNAVFKDSTPLKRISKRALIEKYLNNDLTQAVVCGGLEPLDSLPDLIGFITLFRQNSQDDIVIYTGYTEEEANKLLPKEIKDIGRLIIKYGRFIPDQEPVFDEVLGVKLASSNQYARRVS